MISEVRLGLYAEIPLRLSTDCVSIVASYLVTTKNPDLDDLKDAMACEFMIEYIMDKTLFDNPKFAYLVKMRDMYLPFFKNQSTALDSLPHPKRDFHENYALISNEVSKLDYKMILNKDDTLWSPLFCAAYHGHNEIFVKLCRTAWMYLVSFKVYDFAVSLLLAAYNGNFSIIEFLFKNGEDFNLKTQHFRAAASLASECRYDDIVKFLNAKIPELTLSTVGGSKIQTSDGSIQQAMTPFQAEKFKALQNHVVSLPKQKKIIGSTCPKTTLMSFCSFLMTTLSKEGLLSGRAYVSYQTTLSILSHADDNSKQTIYIPVVSIEPNSKKIVDASHQALFSSTGCSLEYQAEFHNILPIEIEKDSAKIDLQRCTIYFIPDTHREEGFHIDLLTGNIFYILYAELCKDATMFDLAYQKLMQREFYIFHPDNLIEPFRQVITDKVAGFSIPTEVLTLSIDMEQDLPTKYQTLLPTSKLPCARIFNIFNCADLINQLPSEADRKRYREALITKDITAIGSLQPILRAFNIAYIKAHPKMFLIAHLSAKLGQTWE